MSQTNLPVNMLTTFKVIDAHDVHLFSESTDSEQQIFLFQVHKGMGSVNLDLQHAEQQGVWSRPRSLHENGQSSSTTQTLGREGQTQFTWIKQNFPGPPATAVADQLT